MNLFFILRIIGLCLMLIASIFFCYVPYHRLAIIKKKLENISALNVRYVDLLKNLLNLTNCKQISWSIWDQCTAEKLSVTRQRELPFANCQLIYESMSCDCNDKLNESIQQIDNHSYIRYGCIPGSNQQLAMLLINSTIVNVTVKELSGAILEPCILHN